MPGTNEAARIGAGSRQSSGRVRHDLHVSNDLSCGRLQGRDRGTLDTARNGKRERDGSGHPKAAHHLQYRLLDTGICRRVLK